MKSASNQMKQATAKIHQEFVSNASNKEYVKRNHTKASDE